MKGIFFVSGLLSAWARVTMYPETPVLTYWALILGMKLQAGTAGSESIYVEHFSSDQHINIKRAINIHLITSSIWKRPSSHIPSVCVVALTLFYSISVPEVNVRWAICTHRMSPLQDTRKSCSKWVQEERPRRPSADQFWIHALHPDLRTWVRSSILTEPLSAFVKRTQLHIYIYICILILKGWQDYVHLSG